MQDSVRESVLTHVLTTHELAVTHCNEVIALKTDYRRDCGIGDEEYAFRVRSAGVSQGDDCA